MESIYDRYGGQPFWEGILDKFYERNLNDAVLRGYFAGKNIERVKLMNRGLLAAALRTSGDHFPVSVKRVHKTMGIQESHFNHFVANLDSVLRENNVSAEDREEIMTVVGSFKEDVLGLS